jgi:hypothetical protein
LEDKKEALVILAHDGTVESYRVIEKYLKTAEPELSDWGILALEECRVFLEGSLVDRSVGMIMTGLGGEGNRLRYFFVIRAEEGVTFAKPEKIAIKLSFEQTAKRLDSIVEEIQFHSMYVAMLVLIPLNVAVAEFAEGGIQAGNRVDDLLNPCYYVRNDRIPAKEEILRWVQDGGA